MIHNWKFVKGTEEKFRVSYSGVIQKKKEMGTLKNYEIAEIFGVKACTISDIKRGATWKHIK